MKNKLLARILAIMLLFCIMPSIFSLRSFATSTPSGTTPSTTYDGKEALKKWLNTMMGRSSDMFIDGTFIKDGFPDSKDAFFKVTPDSGFSFIKVDGTDEKPIFGVKDNTTGEVYDLTMKIEDTFGGRNIGSGIKKVDNQYYIDLQCSMNSGVKDFIGSKMFIYVSDDISSDVRKLPDNEADFAKLCDVERYDESTSFFAMVIGAVFDPIGTALNLLERLLTILFIALGDGIVYGITLSVGEQVTLDRVIFNMVEKTSINFFGGGRATEIITNTTTSNNIIPVINDIILIWYEVFRNITIVVYLIVLIYICIRVMLVSTSKEKEKYKMMFKNWVVGIGILFFFPYVMKYSIEINNILVKEVGKSATVTEGIDPNSAKSLGDSAIGTGNFVKLDNSKEGHPNVMMYVRNLAARQGRLALVFVYFIMIWQLITIIVLYYKRVFMLAFLITIFPLVVMTYTVDKIGDGKSQTFNTWTNEFFVNVFVQLFHAIAYILVIDAGVAAFMGSGDWLLFTICVAFLFQGEKILRAIFNIKSSASTIGELATTAATVAGMSKIIKEEKLFSKNDAKDEEVPKTTPPRAIPGNNTNPIAPSTNYSNNNYDEDNYVGSSNEASNGNSNTNNIDIQRLQNEVLKGAIESRNKHRKSKIGKFTQRAFRGAGMVTGLAAGMAVGKTSSVISNMAVGREIFNTLSNAARAPIRGISNTYSGRKMKKSILSGEMDTKLGFDSNTTDAAKIASQDAYRKALAKMASTAARKGLDAGKAKFWSELE